MKRIDLIIFMIRIKKHFGNGCLKSGEEREREVAIERM